MFAVGIPVVFSRRAEGEQCCRRHPRRSYSLRVSRWREPKARGPTTDGDNTRRVIDTSSRADGNCLVHVGVIFSSKTSSLIEVQVLEVQVILRCK